MTATGPGPRNHTSVRTPVSGQVVEWLAKDGDLPTPGRTPARPHPEGIG
jgi:hypothetical protein